MHHFSSVFLQKGFWHVWRFVQFYVKVNCLANTWLFQVVYFDEFSTLQNLAIIGACCSCFWTRKQCHHSNLKPFIGARNEYFSVEKRSGCCSERQVVSLGATMSAFRPGVAKICHLMCVLWRPVGINRYGNIHLFPAFLDKVLKINICCFCMLCISSTKYKVCNLNCYKAFAWVFVPETLRIFFLEWITSVIYFFAPF